MMTEQELDDSGTRATTPADPIKSAEAAGLCYVSDQTPGIRRQQQGDVFHYFDRHDREITDEAALQRFKSLGIPPAWTDVWICPKPNGHIQATGRDAKGRKQYRYHPLWREFRDANKYEHMLEFARALPELR